MTVNPQESDRSHSWQSLLGDIQELMQKSLQELPLSVDAASQAEASFWSLFLEHLPHFVAGTVLLSALGKFQDSDSRYFRKRDIPGDLHDDLSQEIDLKLFSSLKRCWTTGNIGAFRAAVRRNMLNDRHRQETRDEHQHERTGIEFDTLPVQSNPLRSGTEDSDREGQWLLEAIDASPELVQQIVALILNDLGWNEIARQLHLASGREAKRIVREALSPKPPWWRIVPA